MPGVVATLAKSYPDLDRELGITISDGGATHGDIRPKCVLNGGLRCVQCRGLSLGRSEREGRRLLFPYVVLQTGVRR